MSLRLFLGKCALSWAGLMLAVSPIFAQAPKPATPAPAVAEDEAPTVKGPTDQPLIPLQRQKGVAGTLVFVHAAAGGYTGQYVQVIATAAPAPAGPANITYGAFLGPMTMKSLDQVMRSTIAMLHAWPQGQKLQLSFSEKPAPAELNPATLAGALAIDSMIRGYDIDPGYAAIGWIQEDGSVEAVGGIPERMGGAGRGRISRIAVPEKNYEQLADYLLSEGIGAFVGTQVFTVKNFNEAGVLALTKLDPATQEMVNLFGSLQRTMAYSQGNVGILRTEGTQTLLKKVLAAAPNHASAQILLDWGTGKRAQISFDGSVDVIDRRAAMLIKAMRAKQNEALQTPRDRVALELGSLRFVADRLDPRARPYATAIARFGVVLQKGTGTTGRPGRLSGSDQKEYDAARDAGGEEWQKLAVVRQQIAEQKQQEKAKEPTPEKEPK